MYPYLLRTLAIERPQQVWCADITHLPLQQGFVYLVDVMDWCSRAVLSWELSNSLDTEYCVAWIVVEAGPILGPDAVVAFTRLSVNLVLAPACRLDCRRWDLKLLEEPTAAGGSQVSKRSSHRNRLSCGTTLGKGVKKTKNMDAPTWNRPRACVGERFSSRSRSERNR